MFINASKDSVCFGYLALTDSVTSCVTARGDINPSDATAWRIIYIGSATLFDETQMQVHTIYAKQTQPI
jgi:hypothetical protein